MKKVLALILSLALMLPVLTACGSSNSGTSTSGTNGGTGEEQDVYNFKFECVLTSVLLVPDGGKMVRCWMSALTDA